jgi:HK97 family phage portal protein
VPDPADASQQWLSEHHAPAPAPAAPLAPEASAGTTLMNPAEWFRAFVTGTTSGDHGPVVNEHTALNYAALYSCVSLIAGTVGSLPLKVYKRRADGGQDEAPERHEWARLQVEFNPNASAMSGRETGLGHLLTWGNSYCQIVRNRLPSRDVIRLQPLGPDIVCPDTDEKGALVYEVYDRGTGLLAATLPRDEVLHVAGFGFDAMIGYSVVKIAKSVIRTGMAQDREAERFITRGIRPPGAIRFPAGKKFADEKQALKFRDTFRKLHSTEDGALNILILEDGAEWTQLGVDPEKAQLLESRKFSPQEICSIYHVPPHMIGMVEKVTCLPTGTPVFTEFGPKAVETVRAGDRVWSFDPAAKRFALKPVFRSEMTGVEPVVTIETRSRSLRCTDNHRVIVRRKFPAPRPGPGGYRAVEWRNVWVDAGDVREGDYLFEPNGLPDFGIRVLPNGRELTHEFMEFCGLLIGDGNLIENGGTVHIARKPGASYMDAYRKSASESFTRAAQGGVAVAAKRPKRPITLRELGYSTRFNSVETVAELKSLGFGGTAHTKRVPGWVFGLAEDLRLAFLRGYLDADGSVNKDGWIVWSSCNRELLDDVRHLCISVGVPVGTIREYDASGEIVIQGRIAHRGRMYQVNSYHVESNRRIGSHDPRYLKRWETAPRRGSVGKFDPGYLGRGPNGSRPGEGFDIPGVSLALVKRVSRGRIAEPVYDLGVEDTHTFIADGLVVHNSWGTGIEEMTIGFVVYCLLPILRRVEQEYNRKFFADGSPYFCEHVLSGLLRGDALKQAQAIQIYLNMGLLSVNEARRILGWNPVAGGNVRYYPLNMGRVDEDGNDIPALAATPAPTPAPAQGVGPTPPSGGARGPARDPAHLAGSLRKAIVGAAARCLRKEAAEATKAAKKPESFLTWLDAFYAKHVEMLAENLGPLSEAWAEAFGACRYVASEHVRQSKAELLVAAECRPDELLAAVERVTERWTSDRLAEIGAELQPDLVPSGS